MHAARTWLAAAALPWGIPVRPPWPVLLAPVIGHAFAGAPHSEIERNRAATVTDPLGSLRGDLRMAWLAARGRPGPELRRHRL